jgi:phytanoyl-CoA hydroxylase
MNNASTITAKEIKFFHENGYLVKRKFVALNVISQLNNKVDEHLEQRIKPFELEYEVDYPGSPKTREEKGGDTIRRLLLAYSRDELFTLWQTNKQATDIIKALFDSRKLYLVQSHHNCIMTKQPQYSSETHWHKDIRYWNFDNNELINTWLPLGNETVENGCLQVIPGSHHWDAPRNRLDERLFLRKDLEENQKWLDKSIDVELNKGDLLFFHAAVFHAAGRNTIDVSKNAIVSTYHSEKNQEIVSPFPDLKRV